MHPSSLRFSICPGGEGAENTRKRGLGKAQSARWGVTAENLSGAVDFAYLEDFVAGDIQVVLEVLAIFRQQAQSWSANLDGEAEGWRDVAHTIKGSARGVGAHALGEAADRAERGTPADLPAVKTALDAAVADIAAYEALKRSQTPNS
jgi:HPt (histidine-containing phosphotransfer) domain-containing protein